MRSQYHLVSYPHVFQFVQENTGMDSLNTLSYLFVAKRDAKVYGYENIPLPEQFSFTHVGVYSIFIPCAICVHAV